MIGVGSHSRVPPRCRPQTHGRRFLYACDGNPAEGYKQQEAGRDRASLEDPAMSQQQRRGVCLSLTFTLSLCLFLLPALRPAAAQAQFIQWLTLREIVVQSAIAGRDGIWGAYIFPGSPYPFGNLGE
jgi:hypothetical protein